MPGTKAGGYKAAQANRNKTTVMIDGVPVKIKKGEFYTVVGKIGGKKSTGGGFAANRELAREAGRKGGMKSRKRPKLSNELRQEIAEARKGLHI